MHSISTFAPMASPSAPSVERAGFDLLTQNALPGTRGVASLLPLLREGYQVLTF